MSTISAGAFAGDVPPSSPDTADHVQDRRKRLAMSTEVSLPRQVLPLGYRVTIAALAVSLVLLPLLYVALVAFLAWLILFHVVQTFISIEYGPYFVFHVPMAILGVLLLLFLVKPIFFRQKETDPDVLTLRPEDEPELFEFVRRLCIAVGARQPASIEVDCEPNAGARISGGLWGLAGGKLVLRIGLPLAAGLTVRQFAGLIGHELGHFRQRGGMTGSYLVRRMTGFFASVVFSRDRLDEKLSRMRYSPNVLAKGFYWIALVFVEPMRGFLWLMMLGAHLLSCHVLRRMEYDADKVEAGLAGVEDFVATSRLLVFLGIAAQRARYDLADAYDNNRLGDDFPSLVLANARQLSSHGDDIFKIIDAGKTGWFDTHPSHSDRIGAVRAAGGERLVRSDEPAPELFSNFASLCRLATESFYREALGSEQWDKARTKMTQVATSEIAGDRNSLRLSAKAMSGYFRHQFTATRPVLATADALQRQPDLAAAITELESARRQVVQIADGMGDAVEQYQESSGVMSATRAQIELCGMFSFNPKVGGALRRAKEMQAKHREVNQSSSQQVSTFEEWARYRLNLSLALLVEPDIIAKLPLDFDADGAPRQPVNPLPAVEGLIRVSDGLNSVLPKIDALREAAISLQIFCPAYSPEEPYQPLVNRIISVDNEVIDLLRDIRSELDSIPYPFAHGTTGCSLGAALVDDVPKNDDPVEAGRCADSTIEKYCTTVMRTLSALTEWAEKAEAAAGLAPLPEPVVRESKVEESEQKFQRRQGRIYWLGFAGRSVAGLALVAAMVWYSLSPPTLPQMVWGSGRGEIAEWRPASFSGTNTSYRAYQPTPPAYLIATSPYNARNPYSVDDPYGINRTGPNPYINHNPYAGNARVPNPYDPNPYARRRNPGFDPQRDLPQVPGTPNYPGSPGYPQSPGYNPSRPNPGYNPGYPGGGSNRPTPGNNRPSPGGYQPGGYQPGGGSQPGGGGGGGRGPGR